MFAALGTQVTVVDERHELLDFCDHEVTEALRYHLRDLGVTFRFGERVTAVDEDELGTLTTLASGKQIPADAVFYSAGRQGAVDRRSTSRRRASRPTRAGGSRSTSTTGRPSSTIYAVGDVIGFPSLAVDLGRAGADRVGARASASRCTTMPELLPFGIYSIPEISYVGKTEHELTEASIPYEVGIAHYRELARGHILGESHGIVKLLVSPEDRTLLGVHAFGTGATEVVHIGQAVMGLGGTIDYLVETVFNYPTLAEAYKVAALDAVNKLRAVSLHRELL